MRLLLIEDDVNVAQVLSDTFEKQGHVLKVFHSGEEGLAELNRERPDAVLLDLRLPKMGGLDILRQIRSRDTELPVIIVTGYPDHKDIAEAMRLGVTDVVQKPYVLKHFSEALTRISKRGPSDASEPSASGDEPR
jgi:DNA-binding response OmpR family regulator